MPSNIFKLLTSHQTHQTLMIRQGMGRYIQTIATFFSWSIQTIRLNRLSMAWIPCQPTKVEEFDLTTIVKFGLKTAIMLSK